MTLAVPSGWVDSVLGCARLFDDIAHNPKQLAFVRDPCDRKAAHCGRRGGKTTGIAAWLYQGMIERPGTRQVYIAQTRGLARQILWDGLLKRMAKRHKLPLRERTSDGYLFIEHPNGSSIWIAGCDNKSEVDKFRGQPFYRVNIDEAQGIPEDILEELVEDALGATLADYDGCLSLTGTPSPLDIGYFHEASIGIKPGWSGGYAWTIADNPFFQDAPKKADSPHQFRWQERLATEAQRAGGADSLSYQREWMGRWVHDAGSLIYPFTGANSWQPENPNHPYGLPEGEYSYGLGVDLGFGERSTAFVKVAKRKDTGKLYVLRAYTRSRLIPTAFASHVQSLRESNRKETGEGLTVVVDEGALGKGYAEQARQMGVPCEEAEKTEKRAYQEYVGGLIRTVTVLIDLHQCRELTGECSKLQFDPETGKEDERYPRHCADAFLYVARRLFPRYNPELAEPAHGSPEWQQVQVRKMREEAIKEAKQRQARARAARR